MPIRDKVYNKLKSIGLTDSKEDFFKYFDNNESVRKQAYNKLRDAGLTDSEEDFYDYMKPEQAKVQQVDEQVKVEPYTHVYGSDGSLIGGTALKEVGKPREVAPEVTERILANKPDYFKSPGQSLVDIPLGREPQKVELDVVKPMDSQFGRNYTANKIIETINDVYSGVGYDYKAQKRIENAIEDSKNPEVVKSRTASQMRGLANDVDALLEEAHGKLKKKAPVGGNAMNALMSSRQYGQDNASVRQEISKLDAAKRLLEQSQNVVDEAGKKGKTNFVAGTLRGFWDNLEGEDFTFGAADASSSASILNALEKVEEGKPLTDAEDALLKASAINMAVQYHYANDLGEGYKAGGVTAESVPFMLEMLINPIAGFGKASAKTLLNYGLKAFAKNAVKGLAKGAVAGAGMAATTGLGNVVSGMNERLSGNYDYMVDNEGKLHVDKKDEVMGSGEALARSFASRAIENQSEMIFRAFDGAGQLLKGVQKYIPGGVNKFFSDIAESKVGQLYKGIKNSPLRKELAEATQVGGIGEEYLEEVYNNLANFAIGEMEWEDVVSLDKNIETLLGLAPTQAMFAMLGLGGMGVQRYNNRKSINNAFGKMSEAQKAKLKELQEMGKLNENKDIAEFIKITIADKNLTPEEKRAEVEYAYNLAKQNAINEVAEVETQDRVEADNASIDAATDTQTGNYAQVTAILSDGLGGTKEVVGNVVGWIGDSPMFVPDGMEVTEENKIPLKPGEWNPETLIARPAEEVKAINEDIIREEVAAQAERESKYAPEVLSRKMELGIPFETADAIYLPIQPMAEGNGWTVEVQPKATNNKTASKSEVIELTNDEFYDLLQADLEAQEAVQAEIAQSESVGEQVNAPVNTEVNNPMENAESTPMSEEVQSATEEKSTQPVIPTKKDGSIDFVAYGREGTLKTLGEKYGEKLPNKVAVTAKALAEDVVKAEEKLAKAEEAYDNAPIGREQKAEQARDKARQELEEVKKEAEYWKAIDEEIKEAQKARETIVNPTVEPDMTDEPMTTEEFVAKALADGGIRLTSDSYKKELGYGEKERKRFPKMFAKKENGGLSIEEAGEWLMQWDSENGTNFFDQEDANAGRDALINFLGSVRTWGDITGYIRRNREQLAERESEGLRNEVESAIEANYHMTPEEYATLQEVESVENPFGGLDVATKDAIFVEAYEEYEQSLNPKQNDEGRTSEIAEGNGVVLPEERTDNEGGTSERQGERPDLSEGAVQQNDAAQEAEQVEEPITIQEGESPVAFAERVLEEQRRKPLRNRANEWAKALGVKVHFIERLEDVENQAAYLALSNGSKVAGWYEGATGEVFLYMPNLDNIAEVDKTYIHEVVAHKGLREMLGKERFNELCDKVWDMMPDKEKAEFIQYEGVNGDTRAAADEYIAYLAEKENLTPEEQTIWDSIVKMFRDMLDKALNGIIGKSKLTDEDISNLIKASYANLKSGASESVSGEGVNLRVKGRNNKSLPNKRKTSESGQPTNNGASLTKFGAKVVNIPKTKKYLDDLVSFIEEKRAFGEHELLHELVVAFDGGEITEDSTDASRYFDIGKGYTIRLSDHKGTPRTFASKGNYDKNLGVVIKLNSNAFAPDKRVNYKEYIYYPDKLDKQRQIDIIRGLKEVLDTKDLSSMPKPDDINESKRTLFRVVGDKNELVAVHNISEDNLRKVLSVGGLIMPSIAITKANMGHEGYGEISLLFDKETINPTDRRNKVYGGDAWTPRFPQMVPKLNEKVSSRVYKKIKELITDRILSENYSLSAELHSDNIERTISDRGIEGYYGKEWMKLAYLLDNGKKIKIPMKMKDYGDMSETILEMAKERGLKASDIQEGGFEFYQNNADFVAAVKNVVDERKLSSIPEEQRDTVRKLLGEKEMKFAYFDTLISAATRMEYDLEHGGLKKILDRAALRKSIEKKVKTDNTDYNKWVDNLFDGIVEKYGIRNGRDWYTPSGNLRPWGQLYDEATPSNILKHMLAANEQGGSGGFFDSNIMGASAETYESIEEIREKGKKRLRRLEEGEYEEWSNSISERMSQICYDFLSEKQRNEFGSSIDAKIAITNAVAKDKSAKGIYKEMKREYPGFSMEHAKQIEEIVKEIQDFAIGYFEAKPRRIVSLNEIRKAIVPKNTSEDILEGLKDNGIEVATYKSGDEAARARLIKKESEGIRFRVSNQNQEIFVSNAQKAVEGIKQEKGTPQQWLAMIEKNGGLKAGEDKWLGLSDWLKGLDKKSVTKDEILDFINQNKIRIKEVHYGGKDMSVEDIKKTSDYKALVEELTEYDSDGNPYISEEKYNHLAKETFEFKQGFKLVDGKLEIKSLYAASLYLDIAPKIIEGIRLNYTTEGLENKAEIALTVPTIESWNENDEIHFGDAGEGRAIAWIRFGETTVPQADFEKAAREADEALTAYQNELADKYMEDGGSGDPTEYLDMMSEEEGKHMRELSGKMIDTREAANANQVRVLVIDEIQSKRHQEGREKGYRNNKAVKEIRNQIKDLESKRDELVIEILHKQGYSHWSEQNPSHTIDVDVIEKAEAGKLGSKEQMDTIKEYNEKMSALDKEISIQINGIPEAPFEKNWSELAMKRMLRYAAENGFDKVAWTKGVQQAQRYSLGNVVDSISISKSRKEEGKYHVTSWDMGTMPISAASGNKTPNELKELFGKEIAQSLIEGVDNLEEGSDTFVLEGADLEVGGEGMKGFYDKMLPSFVNKYVKKWGTKVQDIELPNVEEAGRIMHSVDVTDAMKESVMEGQTMFRVTRADAQKEADKFTSKYNSKPVSVASSDMTDEELEKAVPTSLVEDTRKAFEEGVKGKYSVKSDKIYIFADNVTKEELEDTLFHENLHPMFSGNPIIEEFYTNFNAKYPEQVKMLAEGYEESEVPEEVFVTNLAVGMQRGNFKMVEPFLAESSREDLYNTLKAFGYDYEQERGRRNPERNSGKGSDVAEGKKVANRSRGKEDSEGQRESSREQAEKLRDLFGRVADMGLDGVLGNEAYDRAMMDIYSVLPEDSRKEVIDDAFNHYGMNIAPAVSDYIHGKSDGNILDKIVAIIRNALRKVGFNIDLNGNEVKYLAWRSKKPLDRSNLVDMAEDIYKKYQLKVGEYSTNDDGTTPDGGGTRFRRVYHGSGASFDRFDHSFMGTGEGNQSFGWGSYVTDVKEVGEKYAGLKADNSPIASQTLRWLDENPTYEAFITKGEGARRKKTIANAKEFLKEMKEDGASEDVINAYEQDLKDAERAITEDGYNQTKENMVASLNRHLYEVEIPDDNGSNYIAWDKMLPKGQAERIKDAIRNSKFFKEYEKDYKQLAEERLDAWTKTNGGRAYKLLGNIVWNEKDLSQILSEAGFAGFKYPTNYFSGGNEDGTNNYVIFDEKDLEIKEHTRFRVTPKMDAEYMEAVNSGDMEKAQKMVLEAAKMAMPNTKVVDENGYPKVVYHGTTNGNFTVFDPSVGIEMSKSAKHYKDRNFFTSDKDIADGYSMYMRTSKNDPYPSIPLNIDTEQYVIEKRETPRHYDRLLKKWIPAETGYFVKVKGEFIPNTYAKTPEEAKERFEKRLKGIGYTDTSTVFEVFLNIENPKYVDAEGRLWRNVDFGDVSDEDGIVVENVKDASIPERVGSNGGIATDYVVFNPSQIKSADAVTYDDNGNVIPLSERFNPEQKDIRFKVKETKKERIADLRAEISDLKREVTNARKNSQEEWEVNQRAIISFIKGKLTKEAGEEFGKYRIDQLLNLVNKATTAKDLRKPFQFIEQVINSAIMDREAARMEKLIKTKLQGETSRGVAKGVVVDESTRRLFDSIRGTFKDLINTSIDSELRHVRSEILRFGKEINDLPADDIQGRTILTARQEALKERRKELEAEQEELRKNNVVETKESLKKRYDELVDAMDAHIDGKGAWTIEMQDEYDSIPLREKLAEIREAQAQLDDILTDALNTRRAAYGLKGGERKKMLAEADILDSNYSIAQEELIRLMSEVSRDLEEIIKEGKSRLASRREALDERRSKIVSMGIGAVKDRKVIAPNAALTKEEKWHKWFDNSGLKKFSDFMTAPLNSFNFLLKYIDRNHTIGEGELYNYFMKSQEGALEANNRLYDGLKAYNTAIEEKAKEIFGKSIEKVMKDSGKEYNDRVTKQYMFDSTSHREGERYPIRISKGQALYVWLTWRQEDGRAKLLADGWTEESIAEIEDLIGEDYMKFGEWITDEFFPQLREEKYNKTHIEMFGTSMAKREHYFPFKVNAEDIQEKGEMGESYEGMPSTITGNIIKRTINKSRINTEQNAFDLLYKYGNDMETWNAMAKLRQDLNFLHASKAFRNYMEANSKGLFNTFMKAAEVAVKAYNNSAEANPINDFFVKLNRMWAGSNIGFRLNTAMKQILSYPAFMAYSGNPKFQINLGKYMLNWKGNYDWAKENLPAFRQRIETGDMGMTGMTDPQFDFAKYFKKFTDAGMIPNQLVDALTCAAGARSVYDFEYNQAIKNGLSEEEAKNVAQYNAEVAFNETQQSSREEFVSPIQMSRNVLIKSMMNYQNSNVGYQRMGNEGLLEIMRAKRVYEQDLKNGMNEVEAKKKMANSIARGARKAMVAFTILPGLWYLGGRGIVGITAPLISSLFGGGGDDEPYLDDEAKEGLLVSIGLGTVAGTAGGQLIAGLVQGREYNPMAWMNEMQKDIVGAVNNGWNMNTTKNIALRLAKFGGVNMETWENIYLGAEHAIRTGNFDLVDFMMLINLPASQRKAMAEELYSDMPFMEYADKVSRAQKLFDDYRKYLPYAKTDKNGSKSNAIKKQYIIENLSEEKQDKLEKEKEFKKLQREYGQAEDKAEWLEEHPEYDEMEKDFKSQKVTKEVNREAKKLK